MYKLGIDVGGTNTDAVILDDNLNVVSSIKTHTTQDIESGINNAIHQVIVQSNIQTDYISEAMLGTTQATNAIVERQNLGKVGVIRIGYPATASILPYTEWPKDITKILSDSYSLVHGGYEFNGDEISPFDEDEVREILKSWKNRIDGVAIVGVFSSINNDQEEKVAELTHQILGNSMPVSCSSSIGSIGLIGRENATILNTALFKVIKLVTDGFCKALKSEGITDAQEYLCQNDGTLMSIDYAKSHPILTIGSGPTNSIRGAAYLSKQKEALVLDIGGTTSDIGVLVNGFPRESSKSVNVGGIQTNFRMPDILSIGLGGGSIVRQKEDGTVTVGPDSVGYQITEKAKVFGGNTVTTTDIATKLGMCEVGDPKLIEDLDNDFALKAMSKIKEILEDGLDCMKTSSQDISVILVGGGAIIAPQNLHGVSHIYTDQYGGVANAIGATIAQIGGEFEKVYQYVDISRTDAINDAERQARQQAVSAGAIENTVSTVSVEEIPLSYAPGDTTRVKVKVVGDSHN
ncbi:hydantoinase/oxoprolinase N-terminal domain-containing protein [Companilactobacillus sp. FL22-1]|uniref:hydantoinase/oxoprolinase N-terminal domain-containing protein n=1 Tax=Companilactobacillus sp. FL22-1 TaxID=3373892 RepID=UPI00375419D9